MGQEKIRVNKTNNTRVSSSISESYYILRVKRKGHKLRRKYKKENRNKRDLENRQKENIKADKYEIGKQKKYLEKNKERNEMKHLDVCQDESTYKSEVRKKYRKS